MATKKNATSWSDVKTQLADFDRAGLIGLVQALYAASKDNLAFLHPAVTAIREANASLERVYA